MSTGGGVWFLTGSVCLPERSAEGFLFYGWGPGVQEVTKNRGVFVSASFRKRPQAIAGVRTCSQTSTKLMQAPARVAHFWELKILAKHGIVVVTFGLASVLRVSKVSTVTGIRGFVVAKRKTVVTFGLALVLRISKVSTIAEIGGVVVAKRRTVLIFGLVSVIRVSKPPKVTGMLAKCRTVVTVLESCRFLASQECQQSQGLGGPGGEMQNRRFRICVLC